MANSKKSPSTSKKKSVTTKSNSYYTKKAVKETVKAAKANPKGFFIVLLIIILVVGLGAAFYFLYLKDALNKQDSTPSTDPENPPTEPVEVSDSISINFLMPKNKGNGDAIYIKAGETDILIDAGCIQSSAGVIKEFVDTKCTDGKLEYVIASHADEDHIAGFIGTTKYPGIFDAYKIGTFISFAKTNKEGKAKYTQYVNKRDAAIERGDIDHFYTAYECVTEANGAQKEYQITDSIKMTILNQRYYNENSGDENNYSVCALFTHGSNHYLFTGDLEKEGEESLVSAEMNNNLPKCQLFKAGHHGSKTSSNDCLLSIIQPEVVCISCTSGYNEYGAAEENIFPTQAAINRIGKYTDKVYVTQQTSTNSDGYEAMNGNIEFRCDNGIDYTVTGSNNNTILKETDWFLANRTWPENNV